MSDSSSSDDDVEAPMAKRSRITTPSSSCEGKFEKYVRELVKKNCGEFATTIRDVQQMKKEVERIQTEKNQLEDRMEELQMDKLQLQQENQEIRTQKATSEMRFEIQFRGVLEKLSHQDRELISLKSQLDSNGNNQNQVMTASDGSMEVEQEIHEDDAIPSENSTIQATASDRRTLSNIMMKAEQYNYQNGVIMSDDSDLPPTAGELKYRKKCIFCHLDDHQSTNCEKFTTIDDRLLRLKEQKRCRMCLDVFSGSKKIHNRDICPRRHILCSNCHWDARYANDSQYHHDVVCPFNVLNKNLKARKNKENKRRRENGIPPRFHI